MSSAFDLLAWLSFFAGVVVIAAILLFLGSIFWPCELQASIPTLDQTCAKEQKIERNRSEGIQHLENGRYEAALGVFNSLLVDQPDSVRAYELRAISYLHLLQYGDAIHDATRAIELDRDYAPSYLLRGQAYF